MKGADLHPQDHCIQIFTDASNEGCGTHLDQSSTKGGVSVDQIMLAHNTFSNFLPKRPYLVR